MITKKISQFSVAHCAFSVRLCVTFFVTSRTAEITQSSTEKFLQESFDKYFWLEFSMRYEYLHGDVTDKLDKEYDQIPAQIVSMILAADKRLIK